MKPRDEMDALRRSMVARRLFVTAGALALILALGVSLYAVVAIRATQQTNSPKVDKTVELLAVVKGLAVKINSCVDPTGACARRGQASTAKAIGSINASTRDIIVATLVCRDRGVEGFEPIAHCVDKALALAEVAGR